jgi:hypothetical protein
MALIWEDKPTVPLYPATICWFCVFAEGLAQKEGLTPEDYRKWHVHLRNVHGWSEEISV